VAPCIEGFKSTRQVARLLGILPGRLNTAVWSGRVPEPVRGPSGNFLWQEADVQRAARAFGLQWVQLSDADRSEA